MGRITSSDGTSIAYNQVGSGPPIVLVGGAFVDRSENAPLATELAKSFTVYNYDRRGRGESDDTLPYAVDREIEDIQELIVEAGGWAHLYGISSGGALVLEAAAAGVSVDRLAVYEVPYNLADDAACLGDGHPPATRLATITRPTLVATGGASSESFVGGGGDFFDRAADAITASLPRAERQVIAGQTHMVDPKALAPALERFFYGAIDDAVREYIDAIGAEQRPLFDRVHRLILQTHPDATVALSYKMPTYKVGRRRLHVGVWRHGVSVYGWGQGTDGGFTTRHPDLVTSKGTIQLRADNAMAVPDDDLRDLVRAALTD
ncbi:alpha/beta fold hydrolase [Phytoactinopolyspora limicola]|uniref:alpha/beta fold hydrolase n=1 Tax=Phytoactinopolyspora limicola TaxID=2715536 RepID=UPI001408C088|nr:alpha/beta fold hydrolase [Phytoactinopolyspora limicola]